MDIVPKDIYDWKDEIPDDTYDIVVSGQAFEHIEYPWLTIREIARVVKPSGLCIITAPNAGGEHRYPVDCYRYFADGLRALAKWADLEVIQASVAGVPQLQGTDQWIDVCNDAYLVAQKKPVTLHEVPVPFLYERRVTLDGVKNALLLPDAVYEACRKMDQEKQILILGTGKESEMVFEALGDEKVYGFVDILNEKDDKRLCGKDIMSIEEFVKSYHAYNCLIALDFNSSKIIEEQITQLGIEVFSMYSKI